MTADKLLTSPQPMTWAVLAIIAFTWTGAVQAIPVTFNTALENEYIFRAGFRVNF